MTDGSRGLGQTVEGGVGPSVDVAKDLKSLQNGLGLRRTDLAAAVTPTLRDLVGLGPDADEPTLRLALFDHLIAAAHSLPADQRSAFMHALAINSEERILKDRLARVGKLLDRDLRTVYRRLDAAYTTVARVLQARVSTQVDHATAPSGWTILAMRSVLDLRPDRPTFTAHKNVLAGRAIDHVIESVSVPSSGGGADLEIADLEIAVLDGGGLADVEQPSPSTWRYRVAFPHVIGSGSAWRYTVRVTFPSREACAPFNAVGPLRPCARFEAVVHFPGPTSPGDVLAVDGLPASALHDGVGRRIELDQAGVARAAFETLVPGLAYGITWS